MYIRSLMDRFLGCPGKGARTSVLSLAPKPSFVACCVACAISAAGQARSTPIESWTVWGPSWGKSGLSALSPRIETRIRPTPGGVSFSWGIDRLRCLVWRACSAPDGFMNFYSEDVLPGVTKMVVEDGAGRWAGAAAYAHTYLYAAESRDVAFAVESDQPVVVWLNGTRLPERGGGRCVRALPRQPLGPVPGQGLDVRGAPGTGCDFGRQRPFPRRTPEGRSQAGCGRPFRFRRQPSVHRPLPARLP